MKKIKKTAGLIVLAVLTGFLTAACPTEGPDETGLVSTQSIGQTMVFSNHQTWVRDYETEYVSKTHIKFSGDREVFATVGVPVPNADEENTLEMYTVGYGEIKNGILNFTVEQLGEEHFLPAGYFDHLFAEWIFKYPEDPSIGEEYDPPLEISPADVKGNAVVFFTFNEDNSIDKELFWERFSPSMNYQELDLEHIWFVYVKESCTITSEERVRPGENTYEALNLILEPGWNMIRRKEAYTETAHSSYSLTVVNRNSSPAFNWALIEPETIPPK